MGLAHLSFSLRMEERVKQRHKRSGSIPPPGQTPFRTKWSCVIFKPEQGGRETEQRITHTSPKAKGLRWCWENKAQRLTNSEQKEKAQHSLLYSMLSLQLLHCHADVTQGMCFTSTAQNKPLLGDTLWASLQVTPFPHKRSRLQY